MAKATTSKVLDKNQRNQNHGDSNSKHPHPTRCASLIKLIRARALIPSVSSQSLRLEHRQGRRDKQHDDGGDRITHKLNTHPVKIACADCRSGHHARHSIRHLHVNQ